MRKGQRRWRTVMTIRDDAEWKRVFGEFVNGEEKKRGGVDQREFYGRPGTLISLSCLNTDPFPTKPPHLIFTLTARVQQDNKSNFLGQINTNTANATLGCYSQCNTHSKLFQLVRSLAIIV